MLGGAGLRRDEEELDLDEEKTEGERLREIR
jgi:hypothetical protein